MMNKERRRLRYLRDPLAIRLGELAVTFGRISSTARVISNPEIMRDAFEEAKYMIEWTSAETEPEIAAELVSMQRLVNLWLRAWEKTNQLKDQLHYSLFRQSTGLIVPWIFRGCEISFSKRLK